MASRGSVEVLYHDVELARLVYNELVKLGKTMTYRTWIYRYVSPMVRMLGLQVTSLAGGAGVRTVCVKMPRVLIETLDDAARHYGVTRSELIRWLVQSFANEYISETEGRQG